MQPKKLRGTIIYIIALVGIIVSGFMIYNNLLQKEGYSYSEVITLFEEGKVSEYTLDLNKGKLKFKLRGEDKVQNYGVPYVSMFIEDIKGYVEEYNKAHPENKIAYDYTSSASGSMILSYAPTILLLILIVAFWIYMAKQTGEGGKISAFGKSNIKELPPDRLKVTFADVAGAAEEKAELQEIVEFLKNPQKFNELGARIPKGVLLMGQPGTGKTLLAKAVAGEAGVPFFSISGSDFVEMFVGVGASRVRDLFDKAKKAAPSIIFIDEIDAVGRHRGAGLGGGHDEREQTLNQLLVEMDGFATNQGVIVMAATNRKDILDPALLRPGRFDRQIIVYPPDVKGREEILWVHTKNKPLAPDVDLKVIAKSTAGFTGADLENLANEAALLAARKNKKAITMEEIEEASIKVIAGPEKKSRKILEEDKKVTAYHEAGHAVCTYYLPTQDPVHQISVIPRGMAAGYTISLPKDDQTHVRKRHLEERIVVLLGGRAAEKIVLDDITTGASHDIEVATNIAREMVTRYGFSDLLGPVLYGQENGEVFLGREITHNNNHSPEIANRIDSEIKRIVEEGYNKAISILTEHKDKLELIASKLIENEKLDENEFSSLMQG
jgi:cell division protease FtsH